MASKRDYRDIEETEDVLDSDVGDAVEFWEQKQRELVTNTVDFNLATLADLVRTHEIDLSPRYQRRFRWDAVRQSRLIESFLMNVPVPPIFLNEDTYGQYSVIDGKQRLSAIAAFLDGKLKLKGLKVFYDINDKTFVELPQRLQTVIRTRPTLRAVIILRQSDEDVKFEVFQRLNTGGVRLNAQEIRNSAYPGSLNDLILELSESAHFHALLGIRHKTSSAIYQEMRDAEFVLRFFAFKDTWQDFPGGVKRHMDNYMASNRNAPPEEISKLRNVFLNTLEVAEACFGSQPFRRWDPKRQQWGMQVVASLYDAQMFACQGVTAEEGFSRQMEIVESFKALFEDDGFRRAIDAATNTPSYFQNRISMVTRMLAEVLA